MNLKYLTGCLAAAFLSSWAAQAQTTIAKWTFESSQPGVVTLPAAPGAGVWLTNIVAETGTGTAAGLHAGSATYSSPAGNGSSHSFSSTAWATGDCYQFAVSTLGMQNITITYDQTSSATGPGKFNFAYSTDGVNFTTVGSVNTIQENASPNPTWNGTTASTIYGFSYDLSSILAINNVPVVYFRVVDAATTSSSGGTTASGGTDRLDNFTVNGTSGVSGGTAPVIAGISPASITTTAGSTAAFTVANSGGVASNFWYKITGSATNVVAGATTGTLTLNNVLAGDTANYFVVLSNSFGSATSSVVSLTVTGDPSITSQPGSVSGFFTGTAHFSVGVAATSPVYHWFEYDGTSLYTPLNNGVQTDGSVVFGANSSTLTVTNLQGDETTNFVVVVANAYGSVTSSVASLSVSSSAILAFWDFNGLEFTNTAANATAISNPLPYTGAGTAAPVGTCNDPGTSPFSGAADPNNGAGFSTHLPNFSWGTDNYPAAGVGNKQNGVQFNVSTVGGKNITVSYESRVSATASDYERLQYTTDGVTWIDYPTSSTFAGVASTFLPFSYNLTGFPGVANNPNFGVRVVTEFQSTATYGGSANAGYVGTANTYGTGGTVTYDLVTVSGDAITNNNNPPVITSTAFTNVVTPNYVPVTLNFMVSDDTTPPNQLTYSAESLNPATVNATFTFGGSGANRTLTISQGNNPDQVDTAPVLVTVTDTNGDSTVAWFDLTLTSINQAPTNSLTSLATTNILANATITIPFTVGDDRTSASGLTYSVTSGNNTVVPSANIVINNQGTATPTLIITPATNQVGLAKISVTVSDNDVLGSRDTTANIELMVRPNTNVVLVDYFNYDGGGSLDTLSSGFWNHLSGVFGQLQVSSAYAVVDTLDNTENLQARLLGSPYLINSGTTLYASFIVNMDPEKMPVGNGTYFALFNDGSGVTGPYEGRVLAVTNGVAVPGDYRIGICNFGSSALNGVMFPEDLEPGSNYVVVESLDLANGASTVWINPSSQTSPSVTDTTTAPSATNLYNISEFELRESGGTGGSISVGSLKVGTTFDAVLPSLQLSASGTNAVLYWSDPTLGIQAATNVAGPYFDLPGATAPYTNNLSTNGLMFYRFGQ